MNFMKLAFRRRSLTAIRKVEHSAFTNEVYDTNMPTFGKSIHAAA